MIIPKEHIPEPEVNAIHDDPLVPEEQSPKVVTEIEIPNAEVTPSSPAPSEQGRSRSTVPTEAQLLIAFLILGGVFAISYIPGFEDKNNVEATFEENYAPAVDQVAAPIEETEEIELEATAAFIWDAAKQRALYNKNASAELPLASLTKLMTSLVAVETLGKPGKVAITMDAIAQEGDSGFYDGETFAVEKLSGYTLTSSSNDGAYALAAAAGAALTERQNGANAFIDAMNIRAEEIGLTQTYFSNPTGLDTDSTTSGSYGSARDMAFLMEYLVRHRPEILEDTAESTITLKGEQGLTHAGTNTNEALGQISGLIGSKTGYTTLAGGNLVIAFDAGLNRPVIVSVLGSSREGRFTDVLKLVAFAKKKIAEEEL